MTAINSVPGPASVQDDAAVLRGEGQESQCIIEKRTEATVSPCKPTAVTPAAAGPADFSGTQSTNSCMNLKLKELNKRQRKKLKEVNKIFADKAKCPEKAAEAMRLAAEAAIKEQTRLAQSEIETDMAKREALEALADKEVKLTQSRSLINQLKDLCRELQHQSQQYANDNERIRTEEAQKRKESADEVSAVLENLSERLNKQSEDVVATNQENAELRARLAKVSEVLTLSEEIRSKYEAECTRLGKEAVAQKGVADDALKQLQASEQRSVTYAERVLELQSATQKASEAIKSCHETNIQLSSDKKELAALNQTIRDEYSKAAKLLTCSMEDCKVKGQQIQKLKLAIQRLESLCRCLQNRIRASEVQQKGGAAEPRSLVSGMGNPQNDEQPGMRVHVAFDCSRSLVKLGLTVE